MRAREDHLLILPRSVEEGDDEVVYVGTYRRHTPEQEAKKVKVIDYGSNFYVLDINQFTAYATYVAYLLLAKARVAEASNFVQQISLYGNRCM